MALFLLPIVLLGSFFAYQIVAIDFGSNMGKLVVSAQATRYLNTTISITAPATLGTTILETPYTTRLASGSYTVSFGNIPGYKTPSAETVSLPPEKTVYVVGKYDLILKVVTFTGTYFNATQLTAHHSVTPVVWVNISSQVVTLDSTIFGTRPVGPGQNTSFIFQDTGSFQFWIYGNSKVSGVVSVS